MSLLQRKTAVRAFFCPLRQPPHHIGVGDRRALLHLMGDSRTVSHCARTFDANAPTPILSLPNELLEQIIGVSRRTASMLRLLLLLLCTSLIALHSTLRTPT